MNYPTPDPTTTRGVLLASYTWDQDAARWGAMDEETRLEEALEDVAKIHPRIREVYEVGASHAWYDDRFANGAFAMFEPGPADAAAGRHRAGPRAGSTSPASTARCTTPGSRERSSPGSRAARAIHEAPAPEPLAERLPMDARLASSTASRAATRRRAGS